MAYDYKKHLDEQGYVTINNFMPNKVANEMRNEILKTSHHKAWDLLTTPYRPNTNIKDKMAKSFIDKQRHQQAELARQRKQFSFSFYRSSNNLAHSHKWKSPNNKLEAYLKNKIAPELGLSGELRDIFFASFMKGQFITYHTDGSAGQYAFIYQLSKGWKPRFGGQLELYPKKIKFFKRYIEPKFNTLVLLKLNHPMPHSVKILNNPKHVHRLTISGWLE